MAPSGSVKIIEKFNTHNKIDVCTAYCHTLQQLTRIWHIKNVQIIFNTKLPIVPVYSLDLTCMLQLFHQIPCITTPPNILVSVSVDAKFVT